MRRLSGVGIVAGGAWIALQLMTALRSVGARISPSTLASAGAVAAVLALAAAIRTATGAWRGPLLAELPDAHLAVCAPAEAELIRAAAQLRGTMGGAGHVHRIRLALPAAAWASAAAVALAGPGLLEASPPWVMLLGASTAASLLFPSKAFFYREASGGRVVLHPASVLEELLRSGASRVCVGGERRAP